VVADTTHWLGRPRLDRVAWLVVSDPTVQASMLVAGEADMVEMLQGPALPTVSADTSIRLVFAASLANAYAVFNLKDPTSPARPHPLFADRDLRRALSMAVDRRQMMATIFDSLGSAMSSPFVSGLGIEGAQVLPYDPAHAAALLDTLGWRDTDGDGVRQKGDRPLAFSVSGPTGGSRFKVMTIMQEQLRQVGVRVHADPLEAAVLLSNADAGRFDVSLLGFSGDPNPGALRQTWKSEQRRQGSNYGSYSNPAFDATVDSAVAEFDPAKSRALFTRAGEILAEDAPAIWLYQLRTVSGIHKRFRTAPMPMHAWWAHLDQWSVDPAQMKERDRIGPGAPNQ
jgi:peptide/nickel transport system substrate-binding protein